MLWGCGGLGGGAVAAPVGPAGYVNVVVQVHAQIAEQALQFLARQQVFVVYMCVSSYR